MTPDTPTNELADSSQKATHPRQIETPVAGVPGLRVAVYPSGRRTYVFRYRHPVTKRKTSITLGEVTP
jgi:hypothetical protein